MITIVGTRIYLFEGDEVSFMIKYRRDEDIYNFNSTDTLVFTVRDRDTKAMIFSRVTESLKINGEATAVMSFYNSDLSVLRRGDYIYDLVLETDAGSKHTLIDRAYLNILESTTHKAVELIGGEFHPRSLEDVFSDRMYISSTPLICNFDYVTIEKEEAEGTLIMFNRVEPGNPEYPVDPDDTLILYDRLVNGDPTKPEEEDGTLILF